MPRTSTAKDASVRQAAPKKVITNDEIPEHIGPTSTRPPGLSLSRRATRSRTVTTEKVPAEQWKSQILSLKNNHVIAATVHRQPE